ncbi:MAG TPA: ABC transporter ATP-binding protein [Pseudolabrys sp.]|nr:ABC transporter ATP-binding protein [Pseudolabrys sp.]
MLRVNSVGKIFRSARGEYFALDDVSLTIEDGEFVCLLGPSGCGKSTLLNILAGFEPVSAGTVMFGEAPVRSADRERVMLFQDAGSALLPWLSTEENVRFGLRVRRVPKADWPATIDKYLRMVSLDSHRTKFPAELSGGMRQRLQIARALAVEPKVLLMDEPFAALDALTRRHMHKVLLDIWRRTGKTIVFVTHDIAEAISLADRIAVMSTGPRSTITRLIDIELPRPRDMTNPKVAQLFNEIEAVLTPDVLRSSERLEVH